MLTKQETDLLDAIAKTTVHGTSFIKGEAGEITTYLTQKIAAEQALITGEVNPLVFIDDSVALANGIAGVIDKPKVTKLVADLGKAVQDGEAVKVVALIGDGIAVINDIKALKKG